MHCRPRPLPWGCAVGVWASILLAALPGPSALAAGTPAMPIPQTPTGAPVFVGAAADQHPVFATPIPQHPAMAPNGRSNVHDDGYMSDLYVGPGPLGRDMSTLSTDVNGDCGTITFDSRGRIVSACIGFSGPTLRMFDPHDLSQLASMSLPMRQSVPANIFQDFSGGGYFYLDNRDQVVIGTTTRHLYVIGETGGADNPGFALLHDYDLTGVVPSGDKLTSALPDWSGRYWFVSFNGVVGTVDPGTGAIKSLDTHEEIENSFAVGEDGGVYIATIAALYRFDADATGAPAVSWREVYANSGIHKPGQVDAGTGTTPTLMGSQYVSITDNADPMDVVVYRRDRAFSGTRLVCSVPVFSAGASDTENSLIGTDRAMVVENNYGYTDPTVTENGKSTAPGIWRVDIDPDGRGCHVVWCSNERSPTVVPKLSLANGLVYAYTKDPTSDGSDPWYLTAIDFDTGRTVNKRLAGNGLGYNNNYAPISVGPDGSAYVGALGGLIELRDAIPPPPASASPPGTAIPGRHRRPRPHRRLRLVLRRLGSRRLRVSVANAPGKVKSLTLRLDRRRAVRLRHAPFRHTFAGVSPRAHLVQATLILRGGPHVRLRRRVPAARRHRRPPRRR